MKILIIHTAFFGDIILATPLIRAMQEGLKNVEIHALVKPETVQVLQNNPYLQKIIVFDKRGKDSGFAGLLKIGQKIKKEKFDLVISPHRSFRSAMLARATGAKIRVGFDTSAGAFLYNKKVKYDSSIHEIERNLSLARALGIQSIHKQPQVFPSEEDKTVVDRLLVKANLKSAGSFVALAPGSIWATKRWPLSYYKKLAQILIKNRIRVVLIGGDADCALGREIATGNENVIFNAAGRLSLLQSAELLKRCRVLVSNDSAPLHLATAVGTPVIAIFGPTIPAFGFYPTGSKDKIIETRLSCRPCGMHGGDHCPIGTHVCMKNISPEQIYAGVVDFFE
ncbi:MAG: lipopolysaccharide heptosyltransferase II [Actinobacteria bacterium]|nr:lipopolysaccharide heptosyltransferase II [Actinomycetota bacterium]